MDGEACGETRAPTPEVGEAPDACKANRLGMPLGAAGERASGVVQLQQSGFKDPAPERGLDSTLRCGFARPAPPLSWSCGDVGAGAEHTTSAGVPLSIRESVVLEPPAPAEASEPVCVASLFPLHEVEDSNATASVFGTRLSILSVW